LAEKVQVGRDPYGPPIQSPFNTLMVHGGNEANTYGAMGAITEHGKKPLS